MTGFFSNEAFINGVARAIDLADSRAVFDRVFACLAPEITIYPTEGYYYFTLAAGGRVIWGSLSLYAHNRDEGVLGFGYALKTDKYRDVFLPVEGGGLTLTAKDGVAVEKIDELTYHVTANGRRVTFTLHVEPLRKPSPECLRPDEEYVGPCFDESGLRFALLYNTTANWLYWVLDDTHPDHRASFTRISDDVAIEDRTEYAFYLDRERRRMILVGVEGFNVLQNNWYDGPFDQMPDNYVRLGQIEVQKYLEAAYPHAAGRIDRYGNFLDRPGSRIAVAPYRVYFYRGEIDEVVRAERHAGLEGAAFLAAITRQVFDIPEDLRRQPRRARPSRPEISPVSSTELK